MPNVSSYSLQTSVYTPFLIIENMAVRLLPKLRVASSILAGVAKSNTSYPALELLKFVTAYHDKSPLITKHLGKN